MIAAIIKLVICFLSKGMDTTTLFFLFLLFIILAGCGTSIVIRIKYVTSVFEKNCLILSGFV